MHCRSSTLLVAAVPCCALAAAPALPCLALTHGSCRLSLSRKSVMERVRTPRSSAAQFSDLSVNGDASSRGLVYSPQRADLLSTPRVLVSTPRTCDVPWLHPYTERSRSVRVCLYLRLRALDVV